MEGCIPSLVGSTYVHDSLPSPLALLAFVIAENTAHQPPPDDEQARQDTHHYGSSEINEELQGGGRCGWL